VNVKDVTGSKSLGAQNISQGSQVCGTATLAVVGLSRCVGCVISNPDCCMDLPPFYCVLSCDDGISDRTGPVKGISK
jgi:hypothetical protein